MSKYISFTQAVPCIWHCLPCIQGQQILSSFFPFNVLPFTPVIHNPLPCFLALAWKLNSVNNRQSECLTWWALVKYKGFKTEFEFPAFSTSEGRFLFFFFQEYEVQSMELLRRNCLWPKVASQTAKSQHPAFDTGQLCSVSWEDSGCDRQGGRH